jgi:integration host factor subunit alpha
MRRPTSTRTDLVQALYEEIGLSRDECSHMLEAVLREIISSLVDGDPVKISSFGSFLVRRKAERVGRNPKTGVEVPIMARRVVVFKPSNNLRTGINHVDGGSEGS